MQPACFVLDGIAKSIHPPVTGKALYAIAGDPAVLYSRDGSVVNRDEEPIIADGEAFSTDQPVTVESPAAEV